MSTRYAVLIKDDTTGEEIVSDIKQMEGAAPDIRIGRAVKVPDGVLIGMIKGGPVDAVSGYGFPAGSAGKDNRSPVGVTKIDEPATKGKATKGEAE
ncbi:hypothetical protein FJ422_29630 [Mesorhizobium sp. B2-6-3]|uniref:hypothetical protein n=1 Tax=Mesorhizobium sp. B2-6-3 TaxID=2589914 RepID=UPI00112B776E|nr:hypothetical protein [Mesorhizobium sp. B2-6-3]TPJ76871.1 hypothetical protein FJ422_29630 [Mesorhizobium sp. B2-6-3]